MEGSLKNFLKSLKANESTISMLLGGMVMIVIAILLVNYFRPSPRSQITEESSSTESGQISLRLEDISQDGLVTGDLDLGNAQAGVATESISPIGTGTTHMVNKGEHLWMIAETYYGSGYNWVDIAEANNLVNPGQIEKNQNIIIPNVPSRLATTSNKITTPVSSNATTISGTEYTIQKGDSLWSVALRSYADGYGWIDIWNANKGAINNPDYVEIGQKLRIPR